MNQDVIKWRNKLIQWGTPDSTPTVCDVLLQDPNPARRKAAATVLRWIGDERCVLPLLQAAENDPEQVVRAEAIQAVARFGDRPEVPVVLRRLAKTDKACTAAATDVLDLWKSRKLLPATRRRLIDDCSNAHREADARDAGFTLAQRLRLHAREFSDADLEVILALKPYTYEWKNDRTLMADNKWYTESIECFNDAQTLARLELQHRYTVHPYWKLGRFQRFLYWSRHGFPIKRYDVISSAL